MKKLLLLSLLLCLTKLNAQVCFKAAQTYTTGIQPKAVRNADFDNNGIPDFVSVNCTTTVAGITVLMNYNAATTTFSTSTTYTLPTASSPIDIAVADFDGDGKQDVVTANNSVTNVSVLPGNGNGTFGASTSFTLTAVATAIAVADFNGDSKLDMAVINNSYGVAILINTSTGSGVFTFTTSATISLGYQPTAITTANFDGITGVDIALVNSGSGNVSVLLNTGTGSFGIANNFSVGSSPQGITTGDFDNDGKIDIATANNNSYNLSVLKGIGTAGSFTTAVNYSTSNSVYPEAVITIDFNDDGYLDLVTVGTTSFSVGYAEVLLGTGTGTFGTAIPFPATLNMNVPTKLIAGDYNADGNADFMVSQYSNNSTAMYLNAKPVISGNATICLGATSALTAAGASTYTWSANAGGSTSASVSLTPTVNTTYTVTGAVGTCSASTVETVTVNSLPVMNTIANPSTICAGQTSTITATGASTYVWNPGSMPSASVVVNPTGSTVYTVTGTSSLGCVATKTLQVIVNPNPTVNAGPDKSICIGSNTTLNGTASAGTYSWGPSGDLNNPVVLTPTASPTVTTTYTLTATSAGCTSTDMMILTVNPLPTVCIGNNNPVCASQTIMLNYCGSSVTSYTWTGPNGFTSNVVSPSIPNATIAYSGTYSLSVTDANGCINGSPSNVGVNPLPIITVNSATICPAGSATLTAGGASTYTWNTSANTSTISVSPSSSTAYSVSGTDVNGCIDSAIANVTINLFDSISGTIYDTTTVSGIHLLTNGGVVYLYPVQSSTTAIDTAGLLATGMFANISHINGSYSFSQVIPGSYYLKAVADTHFYHGAVPTYFSTKLNPYRWDSATVIVHSGCNNGNDAGHDISIIELPALTGTGIISGTVTTAQSFGQRLAHGGNNQTMGAPIKGIDVKLGRNPGGSCAATVHADTNGVYQFMGVDTGSYSIYVDIPNFGMVTILTVTLTPANLQSTNNNYCVDSTDIGVGTCSQSNGIKQMAGINNQIAVYPNPNNGLFTIKGTSETNNLRIINELGQIIQTISLKQTNNYEVTLTGLDKGVYYLIGNSNAIQTKKCIVVIN